MASRKEECIRYIRDKVGNNKVLVSSLDALTYIPKSRFQLLVSGGVDSTVCAALLRVALQPNQVMAVHIDNGEFCKKPRTCKLLLSFSCRLHA